MYSITIDDKRILGFFTDKEGSSVSPYMNIKVREALGLFDFPWVRTRQIHEDRIGTVCDISKDEVLEGYDALITDRKGIVLVTVHADCIPVQLYDPKAEVIAAVHAGWRGTEKRIAYKTAQLMKEEYGCKDIHAYIGPGISLCCFETGDDVAERFLQYDGACKRYGEKYHVDLKLVNEMQLREAGIESVTVSDKCTYCDEQYVSYRRMNGTDERMASGIVMLP